MVHAPAEGDAVPAGEVLVSALVAHLQRARDGGPQVAQLH